MFVFTEKIKKSDGSFETFLPNLITCSLLNSKNIDNLVCLAVNSESYLGLVTFEVSDSFKCSFCIHQQATGDIVFHFQGPFCFLIV